MPRRPRLKLAAIPLHFIQRGNNRGACFFAEDDYHSLANSNTYIVIKPSLSKVV